MLRKASPKDQNTIWEILQQAIEQRRQDGSEQWQNGYPNEQTVKDDIAKGYAYVLVDDSTIVGYAAVIFDIEPAYTDIKGKWLTDGEYVTVHRVATSNTVKRKGMGTQLLQMIEQLVLEQNVYSIKIDTNFDNVPMLKIMDRLGYTYCGEVFLSGAPRRAYEKVLSR